MQVKSSSERMKIREPEGEKGSAEANGMTRNGKWERNRV